MTLIAAVLIAACGAQGTPAPRTPPDAGPDVIDAPVTADLAPEVMPLALGVACSDDTACASGMCVDGVCCGARCPTCQRCDLAASRGTCALVPAGTPCGGNLCLAGKFVPQATCDETGACPAPVPIDCAPARCLDNRCVTNCTRDDECEPPSVCRLGGCRRPGGEDIPCVDNDQCASGICAQGFCCDRPCDGVCNSCALPTARGRCQPLPAGQRPDAGCPADGGADTASDASGD